MTNEEALYQFGNYGLLDDGNPPDLLEAMKIAYFALKKQIKKSPVELTDRYPSGQFECPMCQAGVGWHTTYNTPFGEMQSDKMHRKKYCECCVQAIDWSKEEMKNDEL